MKDLMTSDYRKGDNVAEEKTSIEHCEKSDYKYYIYYITSHYYKFPNDNKYHDNAVSINKQYKKII